MIQSLLCFFNLHDYTRWSDPVYLSGWKVVQEQHRICRYCNYAQVRYFR